MTNLIVDVLAKLFRWLSQISGIQFFEVVSLRLAKKRKKMIVYKYMSPERTEVLENTSIRFTQPNLFNDPFESLPNLSEQRQQGADLARAKFSEIPSDSLARILEKFDREILNVPEQVGDHLIALCLTKNSNNALMWSHYADEHRGYAIGFDSDSDFFKPGNYGIRYGLKQVKYSSERQDVSAKQSIDDILNDAEELFFTKSKDWEYEEEFRVLADPRQADNSSIQDANGNTLYLFEFPADVVREVIFGCRMMKEKRKEISELVESKYPKAKLLQAELSTINFDLSIVPYSD